MNLCATSSFKTILLGSEAISSAAAISILIFLSWIHGSRYHKCIPAIARLCIFHRHRMLNLNMVNTHDKNSLPTEVHQSSAPNHNHSRFDLQEELAEASTPD